MKGGSYCMYSDVNVGSPAMAGAAFFVAYRQSKKRGRAYNENLYYRRM
ncbi:MAG: hypothetical protein ACK5MN_01030 [Lachnospiraceae bacterium]